MTREEARQAAEVLQAFADGKKIEYINTVGKNCWKRIGNMDYNNFNFDRYHYRIAKEPAYRPYKGADECWNEMLNHQPFGWVKDKNKERWVGVVFVDDEERDYKSMFDKFIFADGEPFGVKAE